MIGLDYCKVLYESTSRPRLLYLRKIVPLAPSRFGTKSLAIHIKACEKKWEN